MFQTMRCMTTLMKNCVMKKNHESFVSRDFMKWECFSNREWKFSKISAAVVHSFDWKYLVEYWNFLR